jgi:putative flippase GtrA
MTRDTWLHWLKFNAVGGMGIGVQLIALTGLKSGLHIDYLLASALAVEAAVVHNFVWHERFTWSERESKNVAVRFLKFNLTAGMFSILGNILLMAVFVDLARMNYLLANLATIAVCSLGNFVVSDRFVFETTVCDRHRN